MVGLTENPTALNRWMVCGSEISQLINQFESEFSVQETHLHHEERIATQKAFKKQMKDLIDTINKFGNPFLDDCPELIILTSRDCADDSVVATVRSIATIGLTQYKQYCEEVLISREKSIHDSIKKTSFHFSRPLNARKNLKPLNSLNFNEVMHPSLGVSI